LKHLKEVEKVSQKEESKNIINSKQGQENAFKTFSRTTEKFFEVKKIENFFVNFTSNKCLPLHEKYDQKVLGNPLYVVEYIKDIMCNLYEKEVIIFYIESQSA
jgi:hypothetical protein